MTSPNTTHTPLEAHIQQLIDDLDTARAEGVVWTYALIQERLRQGLERHAVETKREEIIAVHREHAIECTGVGEVSCRGCREAGWMSWATYREHLADAVLAILREGRT